MWSSLALHSTAMNSLLSAALLVLALTSSMPMQQSSGMVLASNIHRSKSHGSNEACHDFIKQGDTATFQKKLGKIISAANHGQTTGLPKCVVYNEKDKSYEYSMELPVTVDEGAYKSVVNIGKGLADSGIPHHMVMWRGRWFETCYNGKPVFTTTRYPHGPISKANPAVMEAELPCEGSGSNFTFLKAPGWIIYISNANPAWKINVSLYSRGGKAKIHEDKEYYRKAIEADYAF